MSDAAATVTIGDKSGATSAATATVGSTTNTDTWRYRRRFMFAMTAFFMAMILVAMLKTEIAAVAEIAIVSGVGALVTIFGFYVAGAAWDDHSNRQFQLQSLQSLQSAAQKAGGAT